VQRAVVVVVAAAAAAVVCLHQLQQLSHSERQPAADVK